MSLRLPELDSFEDLLRPVRIEIALLVRLSRHPTSEPYWSTGVYRFDDSDPDRAGAFGTCYSTSSSRPLRWVSAGGLRKVQLYYHVEYR